MKKYILVFICLFLLYLPSVSAQNLTGKVTAINGIKVRSMPTTNSSTIDDGLANGRTVTILETIKSDDSKDTCASKVWYKIIYQYSDTGYGYACSNFILVDSTSTEEDTKNFEEVLKQFPESYHEALKILHNRYPNASFTPIHATWQSGKLMTFSEVVSGEFTEGKNLLWDSNNSRDGWKLLSSYNYNTNSFKNNYSGGGKNWYAVSEKVLMYYLDPRNFLNETDVFMFETLKYLPKNHTIDGVEDILRGSFMANNFVDNSTKKFSDAIMDAAISNSTSPYFIASRIIQEVGTTRSDLVLGKYPPTNSQKDIEKYSKYSEFTGYYNFYNIGASGNDVVYNGLKYAKDKGWNSEYKAITQGAYIISKEYIQQGQYTLYLQKFDIGCKGWRTCLAHQYQQNVQAPYSEGRNTYDAYLKNSGSAMYQKEYDFTIPVYEDMPEITTLPSKESPINYLKTLVIDGKSITNFDGLKTKYSITIPALTKTINIEATPKNNKATITGTGEIEIKSNSQVVKIVATAANGDKLTYEINVTRLESEEEIKLDDILKELRRNFDKYALGLTSYDDVVDVIDKVNSEVEFVVKNTEGKIVKDGNLGTGYEIIISFNEESKSFKVVIYGDNNGDGEITILDLLRIQKYLLNSINLSSEQLESSDVNKDGKVDILDLLLVKKHLLGSINISR